MKKQTISVTDAARHFADCVNRVHYQNVTYVLVKNGKPVARLAPAEEKICTGKQLAEVLDRVSLTEDEAEAWRRDLRQARKRLRDPIDKWQ